MYVWNSREILQVSFAYFISLIINEHIRFMKNLQCKKRSGIKSEIKIVKVSKIFSKKLKKAKIYTLKIKKNVLIRNLVLFWILETVLIRNLY